jgi:protein involved in polysaccharide export with SLBB domain
MRIFSSRIGMRRSRLGLLALLISLGFAASAQNNNSDPLQALKDSMSSEDQQSLLQGVIGKEGATDKKDSKLKLPETVQPKPDQRDIIERTIKTREGRVLRQSYEDPELRADDTVMIDLRSIDDICTRTALGALAQSTPGTPTNGQAAPSQPPPTSQNPLAAVLSAGQSASANAASPLSGLSGLGGLGAASGNGAGNPLSTLSNNPNALNDSNFANYQFDLTRCPLPTEQPKTDDEKKEIDEFRKRVLINNPYKLNRFGVLELPGLPSIPLAGMTPAEATRRLNADPDFGDFFVRLTMLRLSPTGDEALKPFGYDLFEGAPSTFAPVSDIQVPVDYIVGPGDTLDIQLYGSNEQKSYELTVERDGRINFPRLGPIMVSGMTFDHAREVIEQRVDKQLIGSRVSVTIGDLRSIRVFVLGEAEKPGSYTVSGLSTMTNALFVSGGVKKIGSLRNIELKRNGRLVTTLDLYDLLLRGDTSADQQLLPGDVIFIPPIGKTVSVFGSVRRPAIYELKSEHTVEQAIAMAGGLSPDADATQGQLERLLPSRQYEMQNVNLTSAAGRDTLVDNGDKLRVPEIRPTLENSVKLSGYVYRPGQFEYHPGLRLTDVLHSFDELKPEADVHYVMIRREIPPEQHIEVVSADLKRALAARGSAADPELQPRDEIIVFNLSASRTRILEPIIRDLELQANPEKPEQIVSIDGRVKAPGRYPLEPTMHVSDLIRAGGSLSDSAFRGQAELTRYAVTDGDVRKTELITVDLAAIKQGNSTADLLLRPYDTLVVKPIPMWMEPGTIEIAGEVRFPGKYPIHQGETLHSLLVRAGGFTDIAFPYGAVFIREELKKREKDQLDLLANRLQGDLAALSLRAVAGSAFGSGGGGGAASQGLLVGQQLLTQLRATKPVGRLVIDLQAVLKERVGGPEDVVLKDGDTLIVPKATEEVTILGEVQSPTSHVFMAGLTRDEYISKSGGTTQNADRKRIYVVRANGDVVAGYRSGWFRRSQSLEMRPGDTIVVPLDTERVPALPLWQAITTIIYNLAIGAIIVHEYL